MTGTRAHRELRIEIGGEVRVAHLREGRTSIGGPGGPEADLRIPGWPPGPQVEIVVEEKRTLVRVVDRVSVESETGSIAQRPGEAVDVSPGEWIHAAGARIVLHHPSSAVRFTRVGVAWALGMVLAFALLTLAGEPQRPALEGPVLEDRALPLLFRARLAEKAGDWTRAVQMYRDALDAVDGDQARSIANEGLQRCDEQRREAQRAGASSLRL